MLSILLAWRNLFRNTRRTVLTAILISSSLIVIILTDGLVIGMTEILVGSITKTLAGEVQVHKRGFLENLDIDDYIATPEALYETLDGETIVAGYAPRVIAGGMVASSYNVTGGLIYGVDHEREPGVSRIAEAVVEGSWLEGGQRELMIGKPMAELLEISLGDRIVVTTSAVKTGEIAQELFRISAIFELGQPEVDENFVFMNIAAAQALIGAGEGVHEIAIQFTDPMYGQDRNLPLLAALSDDEVLAQNWLDFTPSMGAMMEMIHLPTLIIGAILFLLASLGVINSLFMSIYERIYEFGVIRAIGTNPGQVRLLVLAEAFFLALISCAAGIVLAYLLNTWFSENGIPMGKMEVSGIVLDGNMYTRVTLEQFVKFPLYVVLLTLTAALYPAFFAARITPAEALHKSL